MLRRRRSLPYLLAVVAALAAATFVLAASDGDGTPVPEGGSAFRGERRDGTRARQGLLDALAPLLAARQEVAGASASASDGDGREGLPLPAAEAAAQLFLVGFQGKSQSASFFGRLHARAWGGVVLQRGNYTDESQLATLIGTVTGVARDAGHPTPIVAAVQPGGEGTAFSDLPPEPPPASASPAQAAGQADRAARALRALGIHMTLAPVADLGAAGGPYEARAYSDDARTVTRAVRAAVDAYRARGLAAAVGHFPGEGGASQDPAEGPATVGLALDELRARDVNPFAAVARRAPVIAMSSALYAAYDGATPATLLPDAVAEVRRLGFRGVVLSGDLAAATMASGMTAGEAAVAALRAGCDLLWLPGDAAMQEEAYRAVLGAIRRGELPAGRVRAALRRVLALRRAYRIA